MPKQHNQLDIELLGSLGLNPWAGKTSSQRAQMDAAHLGQKLTLIKGDRKRWFTGMERLYAEHTHNVKFPDDALVIDVIRKYSGSLPNGLDIESPMTLVVYESIGSDEIGVIEIPAVYANHPTFGFKYAKTADYARLSVGAAFSAGTVLVDSPAVTEDKDYAYGIETTVAYIGSTAGVEDGVCISETLAQRLATMAYGTRECSYGKNYIPLNLYGDETYYKPFPDLGDRIRPDGLVFALREWDQDTVCTTMTKRALMQPTELDRRTYGQPGALVIDVDVLRGTNQSNNLPIEADQQPLKYWERTLKFHQRIIKTNEMLEKTVGPNYKMSPLWEYYVTSALFILSAKNGSRREFYRKRTLDDWMIKIQFEYKFIPKVGPKLTDLHAGKAVITLVRPDDEMPVDADGNICHMIKEDISSINRMNPGCADELLLGACELATRKRIKDMYRNNVPIDEIFKYFVGFVKIVSPSSCHIYDRPDIDPLETIQEVMEEGIYAHCPPKMSDQWANILSELREKYPPCNGPVTITTNNGRKVQTEGNIIIGTTYIMELDRNAGEFAAVNSAKRQHHGMPSKITKSDRHSGPVKISPTRWFGESETRSVEPTIGGEVVAEMIDRSNNPLSHRALNRSIIRALNPARIEDAVPRNMFPRTGGRVVELRKHMLQVSGIEFVEGKDGNSISPEELADANR